MVSRGLRSRDVVGRLMKRRVIVPGPLSTPVGPIPPETPCVLHSCDVPPCWRPDHLHPGTVATNNEEMCQRGLQVPSPRERNGNARLREADIRDIRALHAEGVAYLTIGKVFGINRSHVWRIISGAQWAEQ